MTPAGSEPIVTPDLPSNQRSLMVYAGEPYVHDPTLRERLASVAVPTLVLWGESDGIVGPVYGRQFADLIPGARFYLVPGAGHFPQAEQFSCVLQAIRSLEL